MTRTIKDAAADSFQVSGSRVQMPQWMVPFLVLQLGGGIWWAATLSSDVKHMAADRDKAQAQVEVQKLQLERLGRDLDKLANRLDYCPK